MPKELFSFEKRAAQPDFKPPNVLRDSEIRIALRERFTSSNGGRPQQIVEELTVHNGNAIADMVVLQKDLHCFEIKGATDKVNRALIQAEFYEKSFSKISLTTTQNHINWALQHTPSFWGVLLASPRKHGIVVKPVRSAAVNPFFDKEHALLILWKDELVFLASQIPSVVVKTADTRKQLAQKIAVQLKKYELIQKIQEALLLRGRIKQS